MLATIVNTAAVILGAAIGMILKKGFPERLADTLMKGLGLCTIFLGISGSLEGENPLILIISMVIGTLIGEGIDLDDKINRMGKWLERRFAGPGNIDSADAQGATASKNGKSGTIAQGFVTASIIFCVGAMAILGSLEAGLTQDYSILYNKSVMDFVAAIVFASTFGIGVMFSAVLVFVYQGAITLFAQWLAPLLSNETMIHEMTCVGSVIIIGLALNMIGVTKFKVMNYVPAIFIPILLCQFM